ncbi:hypothetical protein V6N13_114307 [Hibiscus sabdariffa]|uniref:Uncharacterized protein n=2 Tax=Hibiscus sabdariffa TaxID=183260 RepID=A0ABR2ALX1_9ROSI
MRGSYISSSLADPLEPPLVPNKLMLGANWRWWFRSTISIEIKLMEPPLGYKKIMYGASLIRGYNLGNSLETGPRKLSLGLNKEEEVGLRPGCDAMLTELGKYGPDRSPGCAVEHADSGK